MSVDSPSCRQNLSSCTVTSKYFASGPVMEDSFSEFQDKKNFTGPKTSQKRNKPKPKKPLKRIKGQKDIRTALKKKKNELISYSNDFDKVCKLSGIDVDSEHLQLAIALSKSLKKSGSTNESNDVEGSTSCNSQERTGKIRTTLQEYGFKIPDIKVTLGRNKKLKNQRKHYKLLLTTETEKQQVISDKYSQVLFENLDYSKVISENLKHFDVTQLYYLATEVSYELIKSNYTFYVEGLIDKAPSSLGNLLKDWSEIPGRPATPCTGEGLKFNFTDIECSQDELDTILSGSYKSAHKIVNTKPQFQVKPIFQENSSITLSVINKITKNASQTTFKMDCNSQIIQNIGNERTYPIVKITETMKTIHANRSNEDNTVEIIDIDAKRLVTLSVTEQVRSFSPDIFDDEVSAILENSECHTNIKTQELCYQITTETNIDVMDLTECVNVVSQKGLTVETTTLSEMPNSQLSQGNNITKRRSNDFMEITECVAGSKQTILVSNVKENVDLTQDSDKGRNDPTLITKRNETLTENENIEGIDLTQSSNSEDDMPFVQISGKEKKEQDSLDNTIILNYDPFFGIHCETSETAVENEISGKLDFPFVKRTQDEVGSFYITNNTVDTDKANIIAIASDDEIENKFTNSKNDQMKNSNIFTKMSGSPVRIEESYCKSSTESFFEEFVYQHSDGSKEHADNDVVCLDESVDKSTVGRSDSTTCDKSDIDLTQDTDSSEEINNDICNKTENSRKSQNSLGKVDHISIDYDELFDDIVDAHTSNSKQSNISSIDDLSDPNKTETIDKQSNDLLSNLSQKSEVFEISDTELDYSLHKSRLENFDIGGISGIDHFSNAHTSKSTSYVDNHCIDNLYLNRSMSDSYLPEVNIRNTNNNTKSKEIRNSAENSNTATSPPFKPPVNRNLVSVETPTNSKYIIKTSQVTPMSDFASMSTPERNKELDKYGLKPFKRKRAIQLLTHLYNQTHPIVESCTRENLPSPSKKLKQDNSHIEPKSPGKIVKSYKKNSKHSPRKIPEQKRTSENIDEKEDDLYEVTNEVPVIKDIESGEEDLVFQKREKAKVHSCRVPLHIAFHNYVCARGGLRDAILRYDPVYIDVIHKGLVASGHRYDPKDLLKFMDKKCITVKTADTNRNNKRHY